MILEHQLAQQIVDRTMDVIGNNINVMNHSGTIIASGDSARIGELHDGALLAIKRGETVEVTDNSTESLQGVKPGINLLLKHESDIIGVIGITGDPESLRDYAALVKITAEMIVAQSELIEQLQQDRRYKEAFISNWVNNQLPANILAEQAQKLAINLSAPRIAILVEFDNTPVSQSRIGQVISLLTPQEQNTLITNVSLNQFLILKHYQPAQEQDSITLYANRLFTLLTQNGLSGINIAIGAHFPESQQLNLSYQSAIQVLELGPKKNPNQPIHCFDDVRLATLLTPLTSLWQGEHLTRPYQNLIQSDRSGQLIKTLQSLFEHQGRMQACANALFIHRNTLRYRLERIEQITGISPLQFSGLVELYLACQLAEPTQTPLSDYSID